MTCTASGVIWEQMTPCCPNRNPRRPGTRGCWVLGSRLAYWDCWYEGERVGDCNALVFPDDWLPDWMRPALPGNHGAIYLRPGHPANPTVGTGHP